VKDFVNDSRDLLYAFFFDPFRSARLADRLEEDLVHHATVLSRCNACNVALRLDLAMDMMMPKYHYLTSSFTIAGT